MAVVSFIGSKSARVDLEWVVVSKRRIYIGLTLLIILLVGLCAGLYLWLVRDITKPALNGQRTVEGARFGTFEGSVSVIRADTHEIIVADLSTRLYPGDTVQTHANGRTSMTLADGSTLTVSPNSVITISENSGTQEGKYAHVRVAVEGGQVKMHTESLTADMSNVIETPLATNKLLSQTAATFDVLEDRSEEIRVSAGSVETSTPGGRTKINAGEYVALDKLGDIKKRDRLLDTPVPYAPLDLQVIAAQENGAAAVTLQWTRPTARADASYQVAVAASPFFVKTGIVFERERLIVPKLLLTALRPGNYFWRVRAVSAAGQASEWSEPQTFTILRNQNGPQTKALKE